MHGINFSQVAPKRAPTSHLDPANGLQVPGDLRQRRVASGLLGFLDRFPQSPRKEGGSGGSGGSEVQAPKFSFKFDLKFTNARMPEHCRIDELLNACVRGPI